MGRPTALEDLELIRRMAVQYGDDQIAGVLNTLVRRTGKGRLWNQEGVATARRNHESWGGPTDILSLGYAAREFQVRDTTIKRLVTSGLLTMEQVAPWTPWENRRADLEAAPIRHILDRLPGGRAISAWAAGRRSSPWRSCRSQHFLRPSSR